MNVVITKKTLPLNYFIDNSLQDATQPEALKNNVVEEVVEPNESLDKIEEGNIIYEQNNDIVILLDACNFCNFKSFPDDSPMDDEEIEDSDLEEDSIDEEDRLEDPELEDDSIDEEDRLEDPELDNDSIDDLRDMDRKRHHRRQHRPKGKITFL